MARLTKADIENKLLSGQSVDWSDSSGKKSRLELSTAAARRLLAYLLTTTVREPTNLSSEFISNLSLAFKRSDDPAVNAAAAGSTSSTAGPWRLQSIETECFGGLNIWGGPLFSFDFDKESILLEGPNASGKSSLVGAILWALSGERPRDQSDAIPHESKEVFGSDGKKAGDWPPIACYPNSVADLSTQPKVRVLLTFKDSRGVISTTERRLDAGKVTTTVDSQFKPPAILIETGVLMPARLGQMRFNEKESRLTDAIQKLTGLDDFVALGGLVEGLCHKGREYLSHRRKELQVAKESFERGIADARNALLPVQISMADYKPADTLDPKGGMATFGKSLDEQAAKLTQVIGSDLASNLDLASSAVQNQIIGAISSAQEEVASGIQALPIWRTLYSISQGFDEEATNRVRAAIETARNSGHEALQFLEKSSKDSRYQLKALAAQWHKEHKKGPVHECPLCEQDISPLTTLTQELEALRSAGDAAARKFDDSLNVIIKQLDSALPASVRKNGSEILALAPRASLIDGIRQNFVAKDRYKKILTKCGGLIEAALLRSPANELAPYSPSSDADPLKSLSDRIVVIERLLGLATWFSECSDKWLLWWETLLKGEMQSTTAGNDASTESLEAHLSRLSEALTKAEPYRKAAAGLRNAWRPGRLILEIEQELQHREDIAKHLEPLKSLGALVESVAREAIEGLSSRVSAILRDTHLNEQFQFHDTQLHKKAGLVVHGHFASDIRIDATLVANTSWLRVVLWAFIFALREEATEQIGNDQFPLLVFDDPQATFDAQHRHRWAQYVAALQSTGNTQVIITTYDEVFLELIKVDGIKGRQALIAAAGKEIGHIGIFEGESLDRKWKKVLAENTPAAGREYISAVRVYVEGLLRIMLRGEDAGVASFVMGASRNKLDELNTAHIAPWNRTEFRTLVSKLDKNKSEIKYLEVSHHATGVMLGMTEARDVEQYWRKVLSPALTRAFWVAREHYVLHGSMKAMHAGTPLVTLPDGYQIKVQTIPLEIHGKAAALSNGRIADGRLDFSEYGTAAHKKITLAQHFAYRLTSPTIEPVARTGDVLIVKEGVDIPDKSLVVAIVNDRVVARRYEIAENNSDVAVLTAQAINPSKIALPVIAHKATLKLYKVVGVLYEDIAWGPCSISDMEICECTGEEMFKSLASNALGLIEVRGQSAEPRALNGQHLIIGKEMTVADALKFLGGKPIIAGDTEDNRYFKRLRVVSADMIVLESLDTSGDYEPIVLSAPGKGKNCLERVWPIAGVLFELPG